MSPLEELKQDVRANAEFFRESGWHATATMHAEMLAAVERLERENAEMREALEPFANMGNCSELLRAREHIPMDLMPNKYFGQITVGDLRRAADVLAKIGGGK